MPEAPYTYSYGCFSTGLNNPLSEDSKRLRFSIFGVLEISLVAWESLNALHVLSRLPGRAFCFFPKTYPCIFYGVDNFKKRLKS